MWVGGTQEAEDGPLRGVHVTPVRTLLPVGPSAIRDKAGVGTRFVGVSIDLAQQFLFALFHLLPVSRHLLQQIGPKIAVEFVCETEDGDEGRNGRNGRAKQGQPVANAQGRLRVLFLSSGAGCLSSYRRAGVVRGHRDGLILGKILHVLVQGFAGLVGLGGFPALNYVAASPVD